MSETSGLIGIGKAQGVAKGKLLLLNNTLYARVFSFDKTNNKAKLMILTGDQLSYTLKEDETGKASINMVGPSNTSPYYNVYSTSYIEPEIQYTSKVIATPS